VFEPGVLARRLVEMPMYANKSVCHVFVRRRRISLSGIRREQQRRCF